MATMTRVLPVANETTREAVPGAEVQNLVGDLAPASNSSITWALARETDATDAAAWSSVEARAVMLAGTMKTLSEGWGRSIAFLAVMFWRMSFGSTCEGTTFFSRTGRTLRKETHLAPR